MPGRRVIIHAGFHKTGTTTIQRFLHANGKHIWPRCSLTLPRRVRKGAGQKALQYSRFPTSDLLDAFGRDLHDVLSEIDVGQSRKVLISDENLAGRMPGRDGQVSYSQTATLMARIEDVVCDIFGTETDVNFHFTVRDPDEWLRSTYKHNLRKTRLTLEPEEYARAYGASADLMGVVDQVASTVTGHVQTSDLADASGIEGPAAPLLDLIELPPHRRRKLEPLPRQNTSYDDALLDEFLALNRSGLTDDAVRAAKADLLRSL